MGHVVCGTSTETQKQTKKNADQPHTMTMKAAPRCRQATSACLFAVFVLVVSWTTGGAAKNAVSAFVASESIAKPPVLCSGTPKHQQGRIFHRIYDDRKSTTTLFSSAASGWSSTTLPRISPSQLQELASKGVVVIKDFISPEFQAALREDVQSLRQAYSKFKVAKIGQDSTNALNTEIRVAETCFLGRGKLSDTPESSARVHLYDALDQLREDLPQPLDSNLAELLYAYYPAGGFYRRHRDAIPGSASTLRKVSLLLYLNDNWTPDQGGQLRLHYDSGGDFLPEGEAPNYQDVDPLGGTLVLFQSDKVPHEVLDTNAERYAVVGWFNRPVTAGDIAELSGGEGAIVQMGALAVAAALVTVGLVQLLS